MGSHSRFSTTTRIRLFNAASSSRDVPPLGLRLAPWDSMSAYADSLFDTLIYRSLSRSPHAVPAARKNRRRDRPLRAAREDDAEVEGGAAHLADGPRSSHARVAKCDQRLRGRSPHVPRDQDDPSSRRRAHRHRPEDGTEALETVRGVFGRDPLDAGLVRRDARRGLPPPDRRQATDAEAQHATCREWLHGDRLDQGDHDPRRDRLPPHLRIHERAGPLFHGGQIRTFTDDRDQGAPAEARDGRVRATGEHRRAGDEARGAGRHPPSQHGTRPGRTDLQAGADFMKSGIVSYGAYIPRHRIRPKDLGTVWGADGEAMGRGLNIRAKSVPGPDEDVITISVEAARACMAKVDIDPTEIGAIYVGSESHPYAGKPTATIVAEAIGSAPVMTAADFEFACKAGTAAIQTSMGLTLSKMMKYSLAIGSDTSQGAPGDALEYSASAGGAALLIGVDHAVADISHTVSYTTDTPDFWRREGQRYPTHGGRFTGEPAYFKHVVNCAQLLFKRAGTTAEDYDYAVFHQPNGKFPVRAAKQLGFKEAQIDTGLCVREIGNTYSGAIMVGLCAILDEAEAGNRIFAVGYGSGAGSDGFDLTVTDEITKLRRDATPTIKELIADQVFLDYATYAKYRGKILMREA